MKKDEIKKEIAAASTKKKAAGSTKKKEAKPKTPKVMSNGRGGVYQILE